MSQNQYVDIYDALGHHRGNRLASACCQRVDEHQNCSSEECECPCHDINAGRYTSTYTIERARELGIRPTDEESLWEALRLIKINIQEPCYPSCTAASCTARRKSSQELHQAIQLIVTVARKHGILEVR